jgi:Ion channel
VAGEGDAIARKPSAANAVTDAQQQQEPKPRRGRRARFGLLLGAVLVAFSIQGVVEPTRWEQVLVTMLLGVTLLLAFWVAEARPTVMRGIAVIVAALVLTSLGEAVHGTVDGGVTRLADALLVVLAPPSVIVGVVRSVRTRQAVTIEAVLGVLSVYILLGMFFANTYGAINDFGGAPFFAAGQPATVAHCLYFSFITITTVGYGDFTARSDLGHTLSATEALMGQIYLVTVVSVLVANLGRSRPARPAS